VRISIHDLTKRFGSLVVVNRASFDIQEGELFTLLGPSGCGKTTLLRLIAGFNQPEEGEIQFDGKRVNEAPPDARGIGMVFQNYALWPHMTVAENVSYGLKIKKEKDIPKRVEAILDKVRLGGLGARYPGQLSGGQQQRVALARALVLNPKILLLDEPLSNLDAKVRITVRAEIRKLQKELGITTIYVTHDQEEALTLSDRIAVFNQGIVQQVGPPKALYERPANRFVADFIGINNLIEGTVKTTAAEELQVETQYGVLRAMPNASFKPGDACVLSVRPENAVIGRREGNLLGGKIVFAAYLGNILRYDVELAPGVLFKADERDPWHHKELAAGSPVAVSFPPTSTIAIKAS
jgi:ABC-type Fe3+/spermidine/putrescine transport system ATPase subunit